MLNNHLSNDIKKYYTPINDKAVETQLVILAKQGSILARNKLLNSQLKAIANITYKQIKKHGRDSELMNDAYSEAVFALDSAIHTYDVESNIWFGFYVQQRFNAAIARFAKAQDTIRVPENVTLNHMAKVDTSKMDDYDLLIHNIEQESKSSSAAHHITSFSTPVGDESKETVGDMIQGESLDVDTMLSNRRLVDELLNNKRNTEAENLILNFMYKHECMFTYKEIAESLGYSKQYINKKITNLRSRLTGTYYETERV